MFVGAFTCQTRRTMSRHGPRLWRLRPTSGSYVCSRHNRHMSMLECLTGEASCAARSVLNKCQSSSFEFLKVSASFPRENPTDQLVNLPQACDNGFSYTLGSLSTCEYGAARARPADIACLRANALRYHQPRKAGKEWH